MKYYESLEQKPPIISALPMTAAACQNGFREGYCYDFLYTNDIMGNRDTGYNSEIGDPAKIEVFENPDVRIRMADCVKRFREADEAGLEKVIPFL